MTTMCSILVIMSIINVKDTSPMVIAIQTTAVIQFDENRNCTNIHIEAFLHDVYKDQLSSTAHTLTKMH